MAATPRKDMKNIPSRAKEQPADAAKETAPITAAKAREAGAVDVFEGGTSAPGAAAPARDAGPTAAVRVEGAAVATGAAAATGGVREAARARIEPAIQKEPDEGGQASKEPGADLAGRLPTGIADLTGSTGKGVPTRTGTSDDGAASPAPFRDSGRAALQAQVDATFGSNDPASSDAGGVAGSTGSGSTIGRRGTPADLGVSADSKGRPGQTPVGIDVFETTVPATGIARSAGDLGILQGMVPGSGADPNATPSVASGASGEDEAGDVEDTPEEKAEEREQTKQDEANHAVYEGAEKFGESAMALGAVLAADPATAPAGALIGAVGGVVWGVTEYLENLDHIVEHHDTQSQRREILWEHLSKQGTGPGNAPGSSQPIDPDVAGHPEITAGYMAWRAAGRERLGLGTPLDGDGDVDPAREGSSTAPSSSGPTDNVSVGMMDKAWRQFLVGQPVEGQAIGGGRVDPTAGTRPGDMGNIDYGPDSTGQWSGQTRTDEPEDALNSLGGSGLSIADAQQGNASDGDSESEEGSTDSETEDD